MLTHLFIILAFLTIFGLIHLHYMDKLVPMLQAIIWVVFNLIFLVMCSPGLFIGWLRERRVKKKLKGPTEAGVFDERIHLS